MEELEKKLKELLEKPEWTDEERKRLSDYLENSEGSELQNIMRDYFLNSSASSSDINAEISDRLLNAIQEKINVPATAARSLILRMWTKRILAASVIILALSSTIYLVLNQKPAKKITSQATTEQPVQKDVAPGHEGAILTLADGSKIVLDSAQNGTLVQQANLQISKKDGQVIYNRQSKQGGEVEYNIMTTAKGRQYALVLSDGSKVWLNAASSIKFPTVFIGNERRVEITGEAYFEVAKNARAPFHVAANGMEVEVLGTHFNVNAYTDEDAIMTTLLEGSVKLIKGNQILRLEPGQQGKIAGDEKFVLQKNADTEAATAWKDGRFLFNRTDIKTIMNQITRWYDVEVVYQGAIPERFFTGDISRNTNLSQILMVLEESKIHFRIEGRRLIVTS